MEGISIFVAVIILVKYNNKNSSSNNRLSGMMVKSEYKRNVLATQPAFGEIIGNLKIIADSIEYFLISQNRPENPIRKESVPFICVINPPRHGKSLLLDTLFVKNENVLVIPISYNTGSPIDYEKELKDVKSATRFFWLRVLKSLLGYGESLCELHGQCFQNDDCDLNWSNVKLLLESNSLYRQNPLYDSNGNLKNVLICVDEFSLLTDECVNQWENINVKQLINKLHEEKRLNPFVQFVFTGFNMRMVDLFDDSSKVQNYYLNMCDFSIARPILSKIVHQYRNNNFNVPSLVFQCVKCSPGLVGQWAEFVQENHFDSGLITFQAHVTWLQNITNSSRIQTNWDILVDYLDVLENFSHDRSKVKRVEESMFNSNLIGITDSNEMKHMVPICFVLISQNVDNDSVLKKLLVELFNEIDTYNMVNKDGRVFEKFVRLSLMIRLHLKQKNNDNNSVEISSLFPGLCFQVCPKQSWLHGQAVLLHCISNKNDLKSFLLDPLYYIFPVGWSALNESINSGGKQIGMNDWLHSNDTNYDILEISKDLLRSGIINNKILSKHNSQGKKEEYQCISLVVSTQINESVAARFYDYIISENANNTDPMKDFLEKNTDLQSQSKSLIDWWGRISGRLRTLQRSFQDNASIIVTSKDAEGVDLVITWLEEIYDSESEVDQELCVTQIFHIAAVELKDRRYTEFAEWQKKFECLLSPRCIVWWFRSMPLYKTCAIKFHVVFAGREHNTD